MTRKSKKQFENQSQSGRSMVEMLGVLAIIAILSIGGIVGYRLAMNYYQANQIAHEMNIMRTDAQIKIAQGTEKLTLGSPYDSGNIQFNGYKTNFDCLDMETETSIPDKVVSCAVANAYYIEMQKIPEGICKPLANLIGKMDNEIAFYINGKSVDAAEGEKGVCSEGLNTLKVIFGADSDSNAVKCDTDAECELLENTPVCDTDRHVCVECTADDDCPYNTDYCEDNTCKTCESGIWNGTDCVECIADGDCTDMPDTPKCNTETNTCVECVENTDCEEALVCRGNECTTCQTEEECQAQGTSYHCSKDSTCIQCSDNLLWDSEGLRCVECIRNENCFEKDINKPVCNTEQGVCEPCPEGESWNNKYKECVVNSCTINQDCNINGKTEYYCRSKGCLTCDSEGNESTDCTFTCEKTETPEEEKVGEITYYKDPYMNWWSAKRYCEALGTQGKATYGTLVSFEELGCKAPESKSCADGELRNTLNARGWTDWVWPQKSNKPCSVWDVNLGNATVDTGGRPTDHNTATSALCK